MPYFVSNEQDDCAGWATIKIDPDGTIETIGCHEEMNDAVAQMIAISLDEGMDPGGEYNRSLEQRDEVTSFQKSQWGMFDREFAEMVRTEHPNIWDAGGNIKGDAQYRILTKIAEQNGVAETDAQVAALELREAWVARHYENFLLPGVIAQIKWLAVGSRGEAHMKDVVRERIEADTADDATRTGVQTMKRAELVHIREVRQYGISDIEVRKHYDEEERTETITFRGYASVFGNDYEVHDAFGSFTERIAPGAFTRTLADNPDVMLLVNHQGLPLARTKSGTLRLVQDNVGLRVEAQLDGDDPDVRAIMPKMLRGDLDEMSFAFRVNDQVWANDFTDRTITEVNLSRGDVSVVSFGANPATVAALRAALADEDVRAQLFAELEGRVLTTADVAPAEPVVDVVDAELVEVEVAELVDVEVDEVRQQGSAHPMSYYQSLLVDRRLSA